MTTQINQNNFSLFPFADVPYVLSLLQTGHPVGTLSDQRGSFSINHLDVPKLTSPTNSFLWKYAIDGACFVGVVALAVATTPEIALALSALALLSGCSVPLKINPDTGQKTLIDIDEDGYNAENIGGDDCDDRNPLVNPDMEEICNGIDDNCDGAIDEGVLNTYYQDSDSDNYGANVSQNACTAPIGYVEQNGDCDDNNPAINPNVTENYINEIDDDCDSVVDDEDVDGYTITNGGDCNDTDSTIYPNAIEIPDDGIDQDCDSKDMITLTTVNCTNGDFTTIQEGIDEVNDGGTVEVCAGTYPEHLIIEKSVAIEGIGEVILDGSDVWDHLVTAEGNYTLSFDNINFTRGGAVIIYGPSNVSFSNCSFYDNTTLSGAYADVVSINLGIAALGVFQTDDGIPTLTMTDSEFFDNDCHGDDSGWQTAGACVITTAPTYLENVSFENNFSDYYIIATKNDLTMDNSYFDSNTITGGGETTGMIYATDGAQVIMNNSTLTNNWAQAASTIFLYRSKVTLNSCKVEDNFSYYALYGAVLLYAHADTEFYSVDTSWDSNDPSDVSIKYNASFYNYTAGATKNFSCTGVPGSCY